MTALFAALACVATMSIRIPTPGTGGYIHPGDAIVILAGIILGPVYGMLAGGIGSALSDLIGGYFVYVPITLVIKGLVALVSGLIYQKMCRYGKKRYAAVILGGITDIVFVAGGYFICEFFLYGSGDRDPGCPPGCLRGEKLTLPAYFTIHRICRWQFLSIHGVQKRISSFPLYERTYPFSTSFYFFNLFIHFFRITFSTRASDHKCKE